VRGDTGTDSRCLEENLREGHRVTGSAQRGECERRKLGQKVSTERRVREGDSGTDSRYLEVSLRGGNWDSQSAPRGECERGTLGQTVSTWRRV